MNKNMLFINNIKGYKLHPIFFPVVGLGLSLWVNKDVVYADLGNYCFFPDYKVSIITIKIITFH